MASIRRSSRDPLLDSQHAGGDRAARQGTAGAGADRRWALAAALMLGSYTPEDPAWMSATDAPVQNLLGRIGASIAVAAVHDRRLWRLGLAVVLGGLGPAASCSTGARSGRWAGLIFAADRVALASVYAPDAAAGGRLDACFRPWRAVRRHACWARCWACCPCGAALGLKLLALLVGVGAAGVGALRAGLHRAELKRCARFLLVGMIMTYAGLMALGRAAHARAARGALAPMRGRAVATAVRRRGGRERAALQDERDEPSPPSGRRRRAGAADRAQNARRAARRRRVGGLPAPDARR